MSVCCTLAAQEAQRPQPLRRRRQNILALQADRARDVDGRRTAEAEPFVLDQIEHDRQRLLVGDDRT